MLKKIINTLFKRKEEDIRFDGDYQICSEDMLRKILKNKPVYSYSLLNRESESLLSSINSFKISTHPISFKEACEKLGFRNYNGFVIDNRMEAIKSCSLVRRNKDSTFDFNINKFTDKQIKFIKNGDLIKVEKHDCTIRYVLKSQKENELKKIYEYMLDEIDKIEKEFMLIRNVTKDTDLKYDIPFHDEFSICKYIKPNIITEVDLEEIHREVKWNILKYKTMYAQYLTSRLEITKKEYESEMYGRIGEENTINTTNTFDNCIAIHNVILPAKDGNGKEYLFEIDTLLITTRGIFILEVKNYGSNGNYELKIDGTGRWSTYYPAKNKEIVRENPNKQNNMHVINFNKFINKHLPQYNGELDANGVIVIGNDNIKITQENPSKNLKRVDELYNYIKEHQNKVFSMDQVKEIADCIEKSKRNIDKPYPINDFYDEFKNNIITIRDDLKLMNEILSYDRSYDFLIDNIRKTSKSEIVYPKIKVTGERIETYDNFLKRYIVSDLTKWFNVYSEDIFETKPEKY